MVERCILGDEIPGIITNLFNPEIRLRLILFGVTNLEWRHISHRASAHYLLNRYGLAGLRLTKSRCSVVALN